LFIIVTSDINLKSIVAKVRLLRRFVVFNKANYGPLGEIADNSTPESIPVVE
jgi:hypothetical protein